MPDTLLNFVHISDTHLLNPQQTPDYAGIQPHLVDYAQQVMSLAYTGIEATTRLIEAINRLPVNVDFVLHTGDVAGASGVDKRMIDNLMARLNAPVIYVQGNHDSGCFGCQPDNGFREHRIKGVQVICLDSYDADGGHAGWLSEGQLDQLDAVCTSSDASPLIVATHHHPVPIGVPWLDELCLRNGDVLHHILQKAKQRLKGVFFGHIHRSLDILQGGILYSSVASANYQFAAWSGIESPALDLCADPGFNLVTMTTDQTYVRHHRFSMR